MMASAGRQRFNMAVEAAGRLYLRFVWTGGVTLA